MLPSPSTPTDRARRPQLSPARRGARARALTLLALALLIAAPVDAAQKPKTVTGWVEEVKLYPGGVRVQAKLDTGADFSSLDCDCITPYERDGAKWVRFSVKGADGKLVSLERQIVRTAKIKRHFGEVQERLVVRLGMCLASRYKEVDVTLVDRTGLEYPMLVGRNFLRGRFVVDSSVKFTTTPNCPTAPRP
jgi:hypothetical protein